MVIGERFAWAHMPKTAGDATYSMLASVPGLVLASDPPRSNQKHVTFWEREAEVTGKLLVMNIRRLPAWALSAAHHKAASGLHPDFRPLPLDSAEEMAESTDPGQMLRWMTDSWRFPIDRWLRAEFLQQDVLELISELGELTPEARLRLEAVGRVNERSYERRLRRWFDDAQIRRMYARNPDWAQVEREVYGDLLTLAAS